jgi:hypothetical protein
MLSLHLLAILGLFLSSALASPWQPPHQQTFDPSSAIDLFAESSTGSPFLLFFRIRLEKGSAIFSS